jgi:hypothetical protein
VERRIPVTRRVGHWLIVAIACLVAGAAKSGESVVLVTADSCPVESISTLDLRKAYLGVAVEVDGHRVRPILMRGDEKLEQIFYQSVVAMSKKSYERRRLSLALKYGTPRLAEFGDVAAVSGALQSEACAITYLWRRDAETIPGIKTIKLLWQDT